MKILIVTTVLICILGLKTINFSHKPTKIIEDYPKPKTIEVVKGAKIPNDTVIGRLKVYDQDFVEKLYEYKTSEDYESIANEFELGAIAKFKNYKNESEQRKKELDTIAKATSFILTVENKLKTRDKNNNIDDLDEEYYKQIRDDAKSLEITFANEDYKVSKEILENSKGFCDKYKITIY
ncbi:hypothetical protein [Clostridium tarantellae]|uniref:Uncharacterized protein n=1 Tax=Clostridium tarantellae TaxID=39493 RepID=A0A6I1MQS9_9CLOT|nr:hypothetical protein [Clostridium tarantellae]MPQ45153.1 hypothetical protein [Clostridium tarantellae]